MASPPLRINPIAVSQLTVGTFFQAALEPLGLEVVAGGGFEQGESLIMLSTEDEQGESCYQSLDDDALIEAVYDAYLKQTGGA